MINNSHENQELFPVIAILSPQITYHVDFEKRDGCDVVARERHESQMSKWGDLLVKAKQLKIFPLF